ncbi:UDP-N-acetylmuramoyl-L-alanine--D-glutamate ligase [Caldanaerobius polysaccharolyticus]|uniref:UDP-N-acetylmuramoyl-L-alanine--D-glutamate ligase n=1 Tax=Caldanaerobius polysaccharolyticus TaxID=44256 RepID=UPI00047D89FE|nr:UDP-N-acetylmuramoyl-L-alanine--D-glutamate ligase [Caldanaerobius polysaccharolyticus]
MKIKGKKVLVVGMAKSGIAVAKVLCGLGAHVIANDVKSHEKLGESLKPLEGLDIEYQLGKPAEELVDDADLIVVSPGVPLDQPFYYRALDLGKELIGEVELAYRLSSSPFVAITGTNGKTTTTSLTYEIFKTAGVKARLAGNIGFPMIEQVLDAGCDTVVVAEVSSFQLETIDSFRPRVSAILNITPDHLNRHKSFENYVNAKARVFMNQRDGDYVVLNYDNDVTRRLAEKAPCEVVFFSRSSILGKGVYVKEDWIVENIYGAENKVIPVKDVYIPGKHNLENALAACAVARLWGIETEVIADTLRSFKGVEHRIEYVATIDGVRYYNDSKGTNTDAAIKAIEALDYPIILIAGGYDKGEDFTPFVRSFNGKVKALILMGVTADRIEKCAREQNFHNVYRAADMREAVMKAKNLAKEGYAVLLSPACASWDMYDNYEQRGKIFKDVVMSLGG